MAMQKHCCPLRPSRTTDSALLTLLWSGTSPAMSSVTATLTVSTDDWVVHHAKGVFIFIVPCSKSFGEHHQTVVVIVSASISSIYCCDQHTFILEYSFLNHCVGRATYRGGIDVRCLHRHDVGKKTLKHRRKCKLTSNQIANKE